MVKDVLYDIEDLNLGCPTLELYFSTLVTMVTLTPEKNQCRLSDYNSIDVKIMHLQIFPPIFLFIGPIYSSYAFLLI